MSFWTAPPTWTADEEVTSAEMQILSDDLVALASIGANQVGATQTTASTSFTDLATVGPTVSLLTGANALVILTAAMDSSVAGGNAVMGFAISGATTQAASNSLSLACTSAAGSQFYNSSAVFAVGLTPGTNVFTAKYQSLGSGSPVASFSNRWIIVIPLP
jgi:hypothetical protein